MKLWSQLSLKCSIVIGYEVIKTNTYRKNSHFEKLHENG